MSTFFILKDDLYDYKELIKKEYYSKKPSFHYGNGPKSIQSIYEEYRNDLDKLDKEKLFLHFRKTYDNQKRYYLVIPRGKKLYQNDHDAYDWIHHICLPRVTRLFFIKYKDVDTNEFYINIKPIYRDFFSGNLQEESKKVRKGQPAFRKKILAEYPTCVVTGVSNPKLLVACHIKDHSKCESIEDKYSKNNGFTMTPTMHLLFDLGYLTFDLDGNLLLSDYLCNEDRESLGLIDKHISIAISDKTIEFLEWHNANTFLCPNKNIENIFAK